MQRACTGWVGTAGSPCTGQHGPALAGVSDAVAGRNKGGGDGLAVRSPPREFSTGSWKGLPTRLFLPGPGTFHTSAGSDLFQESAFLGRSQPVQS
jgi:hypothetical protein